MASPKFTQERWIAATVSLTFILLGCVIIPYPGIQNDEVLFAVPYFQSAGSSIFQFDLLHRHVPVMLMTYLGALKTWLLAPILAILRASYLTVRLPMLAVGALTIWLFVRLLEQAHSRKAAWIGGLLLATDTMFLLTTCFDWGPVALQHFFLVAALLLILKFYQHGLPRSLFLGFLCLGLGLWDKALFTWMLGGIALAALVAFPRELWKHFNPRNIGLAAAGLCVGALPLIIYNFSAGFATFRSNSSFVFNEFQGKAVVLGKTIDGAALLGYLVSEADASAPPSDPRNALERTSILLHSAAGEHRSNRMIAALTVALLLLPLLWRSRVRNALLFCVLASAAAWFQMAITKGAGGASHHAVLLWPIPHLFLALALAEVSIGFAWAPARKILGAAVAIAVAYLAAENILTTNQYLYQFVRYGSSHSWTDAIFQLSDEAGRMPASEVVIDDWGIVDVLAVLNRGKLPLIITDDSFLSPSLSEEARNWQRGLLESALWIGHTPAYQEIPGQADKVIQSAASAGFRKELIKTVPDRHGRQVFEIFRFTRADRPAIN